MNSTRQPTLIGQMTTVYADDRVSASVLRSLGEIVRAEGGDLDVFLLRVGLDGALLTDGESHLSYQKFIDLLNVIACGLDCPDLGMRLARSQAPSAVHPMALAMRNAPTVGAAFRYATDHLHTYGNCVRLSCLDAPHDDAWIVEFEVISRGVGDPRHVAEHAIFGAQLRAACISGGEAVVRELWFEHDPISPIATYQAHAGVPVLFGRARNRVVFTAKTALLPVADRDEAVYDLATRFVDLRYARFDEPLHRRVRRLLGELPANEEAQTADIAAALGMHPRTFQRKLKDEGVRYDSIRDEMRRDLALRYLEHTKLPLINIASMLGYNDLAAFSRSCQRWFSCSPGQLRRSSSTYLNIISELKKIPVVGRPQRNVGTGNFNTSSLYIGMDAV